MSDLEFEVAVRRAKPITFRLGGQAMLEPAAPEDEDGKSAEAVYGKDNHEYVFTPPKNAVMLMPLIESTGDSGVAMTKSTFDWLGQGLSEEDNDRLKRRLRDPKDDLDIDTLSEVLEKLSEKVSGRPTT